MVDIKHKIDVLNVRFKDRDAADGLMQPIRRDIQQIRALKARGF